MNETNQDHCIESALACLRALRGLLRRTRGHASLPEAVPGVLGCLPGLCSGHGARFGTRGTVVPFVRRHL